MKNLKLWSSILTAGLIFTACHNNSTTYSYKVSVQNLTLAQPLSPMIVSYHDRGENLFSIGEKVSVAFEKLAEGGSNVSLLAELKEKTTVESVLGGNGLILPSKTDTITISGRSSDCISVASMLVNTNDAFVGANCINVSTLAVGETSIHKVSAYDAGTEANSELATSIPGPAGGGEGFNATRDDTNFVFIHPNVLTQDGGLATSALIQKHKWDNPVATITVERI